MQLEGILTVVCAASVGLAVRWMQKRNESRMYAFSCEHPNGDTFNIVTNGVGKQHLDNVLCYAGIEHKISQIDVDTLEDNS